MFSGLVIAAVKYFFLRMQKMILLTDIFRLHCKTVLQTDFFCNKFRRTNILFGPPSCRLRYFSKDKRKTLWGHKYYYCGVEGKMMRPSQHMWGGEKIENEIEQFVKILTKCKMKLRSRRRRDKMKLWNRASHGQSVTSLRFIYSRALPSSTTSSPLSTTSLTSHSATDRKSQTYSYSHSGCFVFPSFFIKLPKQKSGSIVDSCRRSSLPT